MTQKFYQKASVQVAIVSAVGLLAVTAITIWHQRSQLKADNQNLLRDVHKKTAEIQQLETLLTPFRTIALERFTGDEKDALRKLADYVVELQRKDAEQTKRIAELENQTKDLDRFKRIAAKHEYRPLSSEIRQQFVRSLTELKDDFEAAEMKIKITQETWTPSTTQKFTSELADILREAGLNVSGPKFATVYLVSQSYPVEWGFNPAQFSLVNRLFISVSQIMKSPKGAMRNTFPKGNIRIHFGGQAVFDDAGRVVIE